MSRVVADVAPDVAGLTDLARRAVALDVGPDLVSILFVEGVMNVMGEHCRYVALV